MSLPRSNKRNSERLFCCQHDAQISASCGTIEQITDEAPALTLVWQQALAFGLGNQRRYGGRFVFPAPTRQTRVPLPRVPRACQLKGVNR